MDRSVAQGRPGVPDGDGLDTGRSEPRPRPWLALAGGLVLVVLAFGIYSASRVDRVYDHFVWQAAAFLEGQAAIRYPVDWAPDAPMGNWFFQDVLPVLSSDGVPRGLLPFPPLPALILLPFVAAFGLATDDQLVFTTLAAIDVGLCWWMLGRLRIDAAVRLATTLFFAFGTTFWYAAQLATTWYQAHIVAVGLTMLAVGLAMRADPTAQDDEPAFDDPGVEPPPPPNVRPLDRLRVDPRQLVAGLLFGLASTARLTVVVAAPFFMLVGSGGSWWRRSWSAGLGALVPVGLLLAYNVATTGHVLHPAYDYLYRLETAAYTALGYEPTWAVEDPRYLPHNAEIMFLTGPDLFPTELPDSLGVRDDPVCTEPGTQRGLFDVRCPLAVPRDIGMSVLLTSPLWLLLLPALRRYGRSRLVTGAALATLIVVLVNLMHFSQGWVQFGYRFSLDAAPFALVLVALGLQGLVDAGRRWAMPLAATLLVVSIVVNAWGVAWGRLLGW
ncbi:MAG: hypothetical protein ACAH65_02285 [Chloroflexota bacterium]